MLPQPQTGHGALGLTTGRAVRSVEVMESPALIILSCSSKGFILVNIIVPPGGFMTRERSCDSPPPSPDGKPCPGDDSKDKRCNLHCCGKI